MTRPARPLALVLCATLLVGASGAWWVGMTPGARASSPELPDYVCIVAPATPFDPAWGIAIDAPRAIPDNARCPVCGMYPGRYPRWAGQVILHDGSTHFFDSPLSLLVFLADPGRYTAYRSEHIIAHYGNDVTSDTWIAAERAFYVRGSDALGPMHAGNLPAFATRDAAERFAAQRGGEVLAHHRIGPELLEALMPATWRHTHPAPPR